MRRESLRFSRFEVKENEAKEEFEHVVKRYVNSSLNEPEKSQNITESTRSGQK